MRKREEDLRIAIVPEKTGSHSVVLSCTDITPMSAGFQRKLEEKAEGGSEHQIKHTLKLYNLTYIFQLAVESSQESATAVVVPGQRPGKLSYLL